MNLHGYVYTLVSYRYASLGFVYTYGPHLPGRRHAYLYSTRPMHSNPLSRRDFYRQTQPPVSEQQKLNSVLWEHREPTAVIT